MSIAAPTRDARVKTRGVARSNKWPATRRKHLKSNPACAMCGGRKLLEVHHVLPFHLAPVQELDPTNLVTLCEDVRSGRNCHLFVGHLGNYRSYNPAAIADAASWNTKIVSRPAPPARIRAAIARL